MNYRVLGIGAGVGVLLTGPLLGVLFLASELNGLPFVPYDVFDWITRVLPGSVVTFGLETMIDSLRFMGFGLSDTVKIAERSIAVLQVLVGAAVVGALVAWITRDSDLRRSLVVGAGMGSIAGVAMSVISIYIEGSEVSPVLVILWLGSVFTVWGGAVGFAKFRLSADFRSRETEPFVPEASRPIGRREFVVRVGASVAVVTVASTWVGSLLAVAARREMEAAVASSVATPTPTSAAASGTLVGATASPTEVPIPVIERMSFPNADDPIVAVSGTRPEYTAVEDHYEVSLRTRPTIVDGSTWKLSISGLVANPLSLSINDLRRDFEPRSEFVTLSCISGRVGSSLISTTQWTGLSLQDLLDRIEPNEDALYLDISCVDGFHELVDLNLIRSDERIMLCYAWDGEPLPIEHGFPLRIWLPDRYGMKQPRWIEKIEVTDKYRAGYWVARGWDEVARVEPTSVIDTVDADSTFEIDGQTFVPVGGIAFAGSKEISKVEVRVDDGEWHEAELRSPLSETTWVVWRYDWPFEAGNHKFEVRCATGGGSPQAEEDRGTHPSGATGIHSKRARL